MKRLYLLIITCLVLSFPQRASAANSFMSLVRTCLNSLKNRVTNSTAFPEKELQKFVHKEMRWERSLNDEELTLLRSFWETNPNKDQMKIFLATYRRSPKKLIAALHAQKATLARMTPGKSFDPSPELSGEALAPIRSLWDHYHAQGWEFIVDAEPSQMRSKTATAEVHPESKRIYLRKAFSPDEPWPLLLSEEVLHIEALDKISQKSKNWDRFIRQQVGFIVAKEQLAKIPQIDRYHWATMHMLDEKFKDLHPDDVAIAQRFIVERDARQRLLELYGTFRSEHPELQTAIWERIYADPNSSAFIDDLITASGYTAGREFTNNLHGLSLDDILSTLKFDDYKRYMYSDPVPLSAEDSALFRNHRNGRPIEWTPANVDALGRGLGSLSREDAGAGIDRIYFEALGSVAFSAPEQLPRLIKTIAENPTREGFTKGGNFQWQLNPIVKKLESLPADIQPKEAMAKIFREAIHGLYVDGHIGEGRRGGATFMYVSHARELSGLARDYFQNIGDREFIGEFKKLHEELYAEEQEMLKRVK